MRRIVYVISKYGVELESTFSYARAVARMNEGCTYKTTIRDCPRKLSKEEQKVVPLRDCLIRAFACLD